MLLSNWVWVHLADDLADINTHRGTLSLIKRSGYRRPLEYEGANNNYLELYRSYQHAGRTQQ